MKRIFLASILLIAVSLTAAFGQWEKTNGPRNFWIEEMAFPDDFQVVVSGEKIFSRPGGTLAWSAVSGLPADYQVKKLFNTDSTAFVRNNSSHFYQSKNGADWSAMSLPDSSLSFSNLFVFDEMLFAAVRINDTLPYKYSLYRSMDDGGTWTDVSPANDIYSVRGIFKEGADYRVYVWSTPSGSLHQVYQSTNGIDWTFLTPSAYIPDAEFAGRQFVFSAWPPGNFRYSDNDGASWSSSQIIPKPEGGYRAVLQNDEALFACFFANYRFLYQIYRSYDGVNWTLLPNVPPLYSPPFVRGNVFYAIGDDNQVYSSADNGDTWTSEGISLPPDFELERIDFDAGKPIAYGIGGIYVKPTNDSIWTADHEGLPELDFYTMEMMTQNGALIAGGKGLFRTNDHGDSWEKINNGLPRLQFFFYSYTQMVAASDRLTIGGGGYLHHSYNGGNTWEQTPYDPDWRDEHGSYCLLTGTGDTLFACKNDSAIYRIYRSYDGGITWDLLGNTPGNPSGGAFGLQYAGGRLLLGRYNSGQIYTSYDQGMTWPDNYYTSDLSRIDELAYADGYYYVGGFGPSPPDKKVLRSTDGANWEKIVFDPTPGQFDTQDLLAKDSLVIVATRYTGVFLSRNHGNTWTNITQDEPGIYSVLSLEMDDLYLYLGTETGVWRRPLSDFGISAAPDLVNPVPACNVSPNPAGQFVQIEFESENWKPGAAAVSVFDVDGKLAVSRPFQNGDRLEVAGLPSGVYFFRITQKAFSFNGKFVKE